MDLIYENLGWMSFNLFLAFLGLFFGWLFYYSKRPLISFISIILWLLFIPNTIYLVTDLQHLYEQWFGTDLLTKLLLIIQYATLAILGLFSYVASMYPIDKIFTKFHFKKQQNARIIILLGVNFLIAFAIILGKYQRTHSLYVFTDFYRVISDVQIVSTTPVLIGLVIFFGIVINLIYYGFKNVIKIKT